MSALSSTAIDAQGVATAEGAHGRGPSTDGGWVLTSLHPASPTQQASIVVKAAGRHFRRMDALVVEMNKREPVGRRVGVSFSAEDCHGFA